MNLKFQQVMDRFTELCRGVTYANRGLEIGPFFRPIRPKEEGFNVLTLDVFSRNDFIKMYANNPNVGPHFKCIEEVAICIRTSQMPR